MKEMILKELSPYLDNASITDCADGSVAVRVPDADTRMFLRFGDRLSAEGWMCVRNRDRMKTRFATYKRDGISLLASFTRDEGVIRLLYDISGRIPPFDDKYEVVTTPLVTQVRPLYYGVDCGMTYVIRLSDGRFVIIDGSLGEHGEMEHLYDILISQNVRDTKPTVAAWFITHAHSDHFGGFVKFFREYKDKVSIERLMYNWPSRELCNMGHDVTPFDEIAASLPKVAVITPHTGQVYKFADASFEILFACEDLYPEFIKNFNDTSIIMRMTLGKHRIIWLGDAMKTASNLVAKRFAEEELASDILQVGHHGYSGGSDALNRAVDPSLLLWPCPDFWFHVVRLWPANQYLISSEKIFATYVSGREETVLDLSVEDLSSSGVTNTRDGTLPYAEDFSHGLVRKLHWTCITGGSTGYRPAKIEISDGECRLETAEAYTVCELRQPWQTEGFDGFEMTLSGRVEKKGEVKLFCDYASPTVYSEEKAIELPLPESGEFTLRVSADRKSGKVKLSLDGRETGDAPYVPEERNGIYLIMKETVITLNALKIEPRA
ncbi:MAG: MBL fold metallo-hydrolase [Clostridia bacterium]|nr:MBL fold metallo-hydrolase [Clostridia bacterium]